MEDKLKELVEGNNEKNRKKWALEWKDQGKKVIGTISSCVPEEVIYAAGMLPWAVTGTWQESTPLANVHRPSNTCSFCTHVLESLLAGDLDFLDGTVIADIDQDLVRLADVWASVERIPFFLMINFPQMNSELAYQFLSKEMKKFIEALEDFSGTKVTDDSLRHAVETYNEMRTLLAKVYELRKKETPPLSGAEVLGITTTARVMPADRFNQALKELLPWLENRKTALSHFNPRVLVSSDMLDDPAYLFLIEGEGCLIAMDDLDNGSRYFMRLVDPSSPDILYSIAKRYISRHSFPRMGYWREQSQQVIDWVKEYNIDGVVELALTSCWPRMWRTQFFKKHINDAGIPHIMIEKEYHFAGAGQMRTRIGA
ncbi:2-hydroxyacyl-CoA dehydratase subunit D, partial [Thermodesulfobacteriota bacterium]